MYACYGIVWSKIFKRRFDSIRQRSSGRICAEGLLVFARGGVAITYAVAPAVDNLIRKANKKVLAVVCIVLVLIFIGDSIYSSKYPNTGEGVTNKVVLGDYDVC